MALEFLQEEDNDQDQATPTHAQVLKAMRESVFAGLCVSMPAEVVGIKNYKKKQMIDVQPFFKKKYPDGEIKDPPVIYNVPVANPRAGNAWIAMPLKVGHSVTLFFSDRSLEKWLSSGKRQYPGDTRKHHISDAIAYPGVYSFSSSVTLPNVDDIIIHNDKTQVNVKPNGHIEISNPTDELVKVLNDMLTILREAVVMTGSNGPQKLRHWKFSALKKRLASFQEK